jgi:hypothetical protein
VTTSELASDTRTTPDSCVAIRLRRDLVSDPTPLGEAVTSGDVVVLRELPRLSLIRLWITPLGTLWLVGGLRT